MESRPGDAPYMPTGTIELRHEASGPVLHMHGDIDAPVVQRWEDGESVDRPQITAVDVSDMAYIDSIGLSFLVRWAQARSSAGQPAVIRKASPRFEQVLHIAGIGSLFVRDE